MPPKVQACDICGCAVGGGFMGILPQFQNNLVGARYNYRSFYHPSTPDNMNGTSQVMSDHFHHTDFWARYYPTDRIQLFAFVPYRVNIRQESENTTILSGIGDATLMANYAVINTGDSANVTWKNTLLLGGSVRLPTGKYMQRDYTRTIMPAQFQLGTGAFSYALNGIYTTRLGKYGLNLDASYRFNQTNEIDYRWGNQIAVSAMLFYWHKTDKYVFLPQAGLLYENVKMDHQYGKPKVQTGGVSTLCHAGVDVYVNRYVFNVFVQYALQQDLPYAQPVNTLRSGLGAAIMF